MRDAAERRPASGLAPSRFVQGGLARFAERAGVAKQRQTAVIELKAVPFDPAFIGQINVYLSAVDDLLRHPGDKPTIGLLLCRSKDRIVVEYALRDLKKPIGLAGCETKIVEKLPENLKGSRPTVEELEAELSREENER